VAAQTFDVVVVGTGPGGYVAAIRCAQLGLTVATVEDDRPGGVCLNWGCIPTKALLRNAEVVGLFQRAQEFGITVGEWKADYAQAVQRSRKVADRMAKGVEFLFRKNKITLFPGRGTLKSPRLVEVTGKDAAGKDSVQSLEARRAVILGTGSEPRSLPGVTIDEKRIISSTGAVTNESRPGSLVIIGAGAVGIEFADVYAAYGVSVTVLEALPRVLPIEDDEVSAQIARLFSRRGITIRTGVRVKSVTPGASSVAVAVEAEGKTETIETDQVLMAVGRAARTRVLGL
jgi:dihydrolipoamide dehydrogenase